MPNICIHNSNRFGLIHDFYYYYFGIRLPTNRIGQFVVFPSIPMELMFMLQAPLKKGHFSSDYKITAITLKVNKTNDKTTNQRIKSMPQPTHERFTFRKCKPHDNLAITHTAHGSIYM